MKAQYPKSPKEMYDEMAGIEVGGSVYTLKKPSPFEVDYIERVSRSSPETPDESQDKAYVYLRTNRGTRYRMVADCAADRVAMEIEDDDGWKTYSNDLSGFRYRSPGHPEGGQTWEYEGN